MPRGRGPCSHRGVTRSGDEVASPHQAGVPTRGSGIQPVVLPVRLSLRPVAITDLASLGLIPHSTLLQQDRLRALQGQERGRCSDLP